MSSPSTEAIGPTEPDGPDADPDADPEQVARMIALRRLESAPRTRAELGAHLAARGVADEVAIIVLDRFADVGLIDDAAFARAWVATRHAGRGLGRSTLRQELRRKGVDDDLIEDALAQIDDDDERARASALAQQRAARLRGVPTDVALRRLVGALTRRGYAPGLSLDVAREALADAS